MERQDYINQINSLQVTIKNLLNMIDTLRQTLDSVMASTMSVDESFDELISQVHEDYADL